MSLRRLALARRHPAPRPPRPPPYLWALRPYFGQVRGQLLIGSIGGLISNVAVALPFVAIGRAFDVALAFERGEASSGDVGLAVAGVFGAIVVFELSKMVKRWWLNTAWAGMLGNLRADAYRGVLALPAEALAVQPVGDAVARIVGDAEVVAAGFGEVVFETWDTLLLCGTLVVAMLLYDAELAAWALAPVPVIVVLAWLSGRVASSRTRVARHAAGALSGALQEQLSGLRLLLACGATGPAARHIELLSSTQTRAQIRVARVAEATAPLAAVLVGSGAALLLWRGSRAVLEGALTLGGFVAFLQIYFRFGGRAPRIARMVTTIRAGGSAYARIAPLLADPNPLSGEGRWASFRWGRIHGDRPARDTAGPPTEAHPVVVRDVTFSYPGARSAALRDVSFDIPGGGWIVVTGRVGSGKSTLCRLLAGLDRPDGGSVLVAAADPASPVRPPAARVGYVAQEPDLFSGTVAENVLLGGAGLESRATLCQAAAVAGLDRDLAAFGMDYSTEVGELGARVSGGQRQRIALARALAAFSPRRPGLLVLDDPFSAVDPETEAGIMDALRGCFGPGAPPGQRTTVILCTSRLTEVAPDDMVAVLDGGRLVETGTHAALLGAGGAYARMYRAQEGR